MSSGLNECNLAMDFVMKSVVTQHASCLTCTTTLDVY